MELMLVHRIKEGFYFLSACSVRLLRVVLAERESSSISVSRGHLRKLTWMSVFCNVISLGHEGRINLRKLFASGLLPMIPINQPSG